VSSEFNDLLLDLQLPLGLGGKDLVFEFLERPDFFLYLLSFFFLLKLF